MIKSLLLSALLGAIGAHALVDPDISRQLIGSSAGGSRGANIKIWQGVNDGELKYNATVPLGFGGGLQIPKRDAEHQLERRAKLEWNTTLAPGTLTDHPPSLNEDYPNVHCFPQPVSHLDPSAPKRQFCQRYWVNADYYKPGGPIYLFDPGEQAADFL
ncbi:Thymus-specific serine protease [Vanrija albida]|uniref:Thymus-specific serine protease n=1 Tax=Vanrija albida TaxID=181172 RepID=A0ABR3PR00_9TREE